MRPAARRLLVVNYPAGSRGSQPQRVAAVIAAHNVGRAVAATVRACRAIPSVDLLIVVDDGSTDDTGRAARAAGAVVVRHPINLGQGAALQTGITYVLERTDARYLVTFDADGQHDPAYLMEVVQPVLDGVYDMCIGSRCIKNEGFQTSFMCRVGIRFLSWLIHILCGQRILDVTSGFRATGPQLTAYFAEHYASDYPEPEAILAATLAGFRVGEAPVVMKERQGGVSSIRSFKSAYYMIKVSLSLIIDRLSIKKIHQPKSK